jgi:uncharacterized protein with FMN-binding domain
MKKILKTISIIIGALFIIALVFTFYLSRGTNSHESIEIIDINVSDLSDGTYSGEYSQGRWRNIVEVTVDQGKIIKIEPIQSVLFEREEITNQIFERVIDEQKVTVDTISGATVTSKAYLKSIEDALSNKK